MLLNRCGVRVRRRSRLAWVLVLLLGLCGQSLHSAVYEVAQRHSSADDANPGTLARPFKTIGRAAEIVQPGDTVRVHDGTYRERVLVKTSGTPELPIRFIAAEAAHVVVTGADALSKWSRSGDARAIYQVPWPHRFITWSRQMTHPGDEHHRLIGRCEQVIVEGYLLRQVLGLDQLAPGTFFADTTSQVLFVWDAASRDPNRLPVEASVRQEVFRVEGDHVQLWGFTFRYAANMAQRAGVSLHGRGCVLQDCIVEQMNASGALFAGEDQAVRRCQFRQNGQLGFSANRAHGLLLTGCLVEDNNVKGFDRGWEAGGNKLVFCRNVVLEQSRFLRNRGNGIWFDIGNENCTVRNCLIADNEDSGIFYEISFSLRAQDNVILGNGFATNPGAWGAQAGISISSSPDCVVERNLILGNREGFNFREQPRTTPRIDDKAAVPVWNHDQVIRNNVIVHNRDAQVWGWFDIADNRHWPKGEAVGGRSGNEAKPADQASPFLSKDRGATPENLSLEDLNLKFEQNVYFSGEGRGAFNWGVRWKKNRQYDTLESFQAALGIDSGSQSFDPGFANVKALDFRVAPELAGRLSQRLPLGGVPGCTFGVQQR